MNNVQTAITAIHSMDNDELNQVVEALKLRRQYLTKQATRSLTVGEKVRFTSTKTNTVKQGTVIKVARKYVTVDCGPYDTWKVPGNMVELV